ncbi:uncharacterized protein (DUF1330 family) [Rhodococcus sp. LBL1]|uniref:Uncharacterized protein (DUF1330 family) n=1 Tax=Prescottella agglutinans TaxID=1644129 RepID=A0ABT6MB12_9NOCA|nr:DUF1330 domain-containing protein [Prescottella agglutinans]MDH6281493.1 uncharacterized protein (DUF1330 family) [Prescottella agglutinans]MDH6680647.1 uncharacterized protein (DUF1330 family) [Rhodococcus sp. LBL1]MDH6686032.1 uncharacterized protein (DUF1330 family) [Rhodococcus sp. LBL2]WFR71661.1 DUF1330 domain-containing protein [Prescottella defluvii]
MSAFAIAHLRSVDFGADVVEYLERIDATLAPFDGRFVVHGSETTVLEGDWVGDLVVIEFPSRRMALEWYQSPAYQDIVALRTENSDGTAIIVDEVAHPHRATDVIVSAS